MEKLISILKDINPDIDYMTENALVDNGIFDSMQIMMLIVQIQEEFNIEVDPDDVTPENYNSAKSIMELINEYQSKQV